MKKSILRLSSYIIQYWRPYLCSYTVLIRFFKINYRSLGIDILSKRSPLVLDLENVTAVWLLLAYQSLSGKKWGVALSCCKSILVGLLHQSKCNFIHAAHVNHCPVTLPSVIIRLIIWSSRSWPHIQFLVTEYSLLPHHTWIRLECNWMFHVYNMRCYYFTVVIFYAIFSPIVMQDIRHGIEC